MSSLFDGDAPLGYEGLCRATALLKKKYGCLLSFSIGKTVLGRNIPAYILGGGTPGVLYVGGVHALEYITSMLLLRFTGELCDSLTQCDRPAGHDIARLLRSRSVYIVPMLNPDGVEIHLHGAESAGTLRGAVRQISGGDYGSWQANARGVDLNHNFNAGFKILHEEERESGITGPAPRRYGGCRPESEPETHALCNLCRRMYFGRVYAFHSQGEEIYWRYGERTPRSALEMAKALAAAGGYTVAQPEGLAAHGGFKDWFISVFARPGFTIEVGRGVNPLPLSDFDAIYEKIFPMLMAGLFL